LKNTKEIFRLGMTAPEVIVKIIEANPDIAALCFKIYTPTKTLDEELVIPLRISLKRMLRHDPPELEKGIWLKKEEVTLERLNKIIDALPRKQALAILSKVKLDPTTAFHLPLMDFRCEATPKNLRRIQNFFRKIGQKGTVLFSGRSYHYYGIELLAEKDWLTFLGTCLLFIGCVDSRYIGHLLISGQACLRISPTTRKPCLPKVVAIL